MNMMHLHSIFLFFPEHHCIHWLFVFEQITLLLWVMDHEKAPELVMNWSAHLTFVFSLRQHKEVMPGRLKPEHAPGHELHTKALSGKHCANTSVY